MVIGDRIGCETESIPRGPPDPYSVLKIGRPVRRRLLKIVQSSADKEYARRAQAVLTLEQCGGNVSETCRRTHAARSAVQKWRGLFEHGGLEGLKPQARGREDWKATAELLERLAKLVQTDPTALGYLRSRWSSELLALELKRCGAVQVHATTIRRWLAWTTTSFIAVAWCRDG